MGWAARYNTWLFIKLTPKGVVFSFLFFSFLFCSVLFCSVLFCSVLFCSVLFISFLFFSLLWAKFDRHAACFRLPNLSAPVTYKARISHLCYFGIHLDSDDQTQSLNRHVLVEVFMRLVFLLEKAYRLICNILVPNTVHNSIIWLCVTPSMQNLTELHV